MKKHLVEECCIVLMLSLLFLAAKNPPEYSAASAITIALPAGNDSLRNIQKDSIPAIIISPSSAGEVNFPHQQHYEELEIECKTCHHEQDAANIQIPHEKYFEQSGIECRICHQTTGASRMTAQSCGRCHPRGQAGTADVARSAKAVIHQKCWECHEVGTGAAASQSCRLCHSGERSHR